MDVYVYRAALLCAECGEATKTRLGGPVGGSADDESTYDSNDYPKGPYPDGGGEADSPQHCGSCRVLLENPLTDNGRDYVLTNVYDSLGGVVGEWAEFYGLQIRD